jgi:hypothetical protein
MIVALASLLFVAVIAFLLFIRTKDLPPAEPVSPFQHLDERKASIYENLRDLQFEYRLGKMSDDDYQRSKIDLQKELARVMEEVDRVAKQQPEPVLVRAKPASPNATGNPAASPWVCPHCKAQFPQSLKFCGECGKPMKAQA